MKPKDFIGEKATYDPNGQMIFGNKGEEQQLLLDVRGWGAIWNYFQADLPSLNFQDELGQWITDAINEKLEREKK